MFQTLQNKIKKTNFVYKMTEVYIVGDNNHSESKNESDEDDLTDDSENLMIQTIKK